MGNLVVHDFASVNLKGLWPQIILGLVVDPDWLGCSVDDTKLGVVDVLGSVGFVMVNNVGLLGRSSDRK